MQIGETMSRIYFAKNIKLYNKYKLYIALYCFKK